MTVDNEINQIKTFLYLKWPSHYSFNLRYISGYIRNQTEMLQYYCVIISDQTNYEFWSLPFDTELEVWRLIENHIIPEDYDK